MMVSCLLSLFSDGAFLVFSAFYGCCLFLHALVDRHCLFSLCSPTYFKKCQHSFSVASAWLGRKAKHRMVQQPELKQIGHLRRLPRYFALITNEICPPVSIKSSNVTILGFRCWCMAFGSRTSLVPPSRLHGEEFSTATERGGEREWLKLTKRLPKKYLGCRNGEMER